MVKFYNHEEKCFKIPVIIEAYPFPTEIYRMMIYEIIKYSDSQGYCRLSNKDFIKLLSEQWERKDEDDIEEFYFPPLNLDITQIQRHLQKLEKYCFIKKRWFEIPNDTSSRIIEFNPVCMTRYPDHVNRFLNKREKFLRGDATPKTGRRDGDATETRRRGETRPLFGKLNLYKNNSQSDISDKEIVLSSPTARIAVPDGTATPFSDYPVLARHIFEYWNNLGKPLKPCQAKTSKTFHRAMEGITKALSRCDNDEELLGSIIGDYHDLLSNADMTKLSLGIESHNVPMDMFFCGFTKFMKIKYNNPVSGIISWFDECSKGYDYLWGKYGLDEIPDEYPAVTDAVFDEWEQSEFATKSKPTMKDENHFRLTAKKMVEWMEDNHDQFRLDPQYLRYPQSAIAGILFPALRMDIKGQDPKMVTPGWLSSDTMFERRLPIYLKVKGLA